MCFRSEHVASISTRVNGAAQAIAETIAYRADNSLIARRFGNGLVEQRRYELQGRLLDQTLGTVDTRNYQYDANGNVLVRPATPQNKGFAYDSLDRLINDATNGQDIRLGYDPNGNRLSRAANDGRFSEAYDYTPAGNRLLILDKLYTTAPQTPPQRERTSTYNNTGRLFQVFDSGSLTATYVYNGNGLRTRKVTAADTILYHYNQQGKLIEETREDGRLIRDYIWQDNEPVAQIDSRGTAESLVYLHTDHLVTPRVGTNPSGTVVWRWGGEAFGQTMANEDPDGDGQIVVVNLRFPGQYYDSETGLHYNYFRYLDPETGRYINADPIGQLGGINLYSYAENNPIRNIDPLGLVSGPLDKTPRPGPTGNPIEGPYRPPPSPADKVANAAAKQLAKQLARALGIPPQLIGKTPGLLGGIGLLLTPSQLGCGSFDCNNNGIPDDQEQNPNQSECQ